EANVAHIVFTQRKRPRLLKAVAVDVFDGGNRDDGARKRVVASLAGRRPERGDGDVRPRRAAQTFDGVSESELVRRLAVDARDTVTGQNPGLGAGGVFDRTDDGQVVIFGGNLDADSAELALGFFFQVVVFGGVHELAVRVQRVEHAFEGALDEIMVSEF